MVWWILGCTLRPGGVPEPEVVDAPVREGRQAERVIAVGKGPDALFHDAARARVLVANVEDSHVSVIATSTRSVAASIPIAKGPWGFVSLSSDRVAVTSWERALSIIDLSTDTVEKAFSLPFNAGGLAVSADGGSAWVVSPTEDAVVSISLTDGAEISRFNTGKGPDGIARIADRLVVGHTKDGTIGIYDLDGNRVGLLSPGGKPELVHPSHDGRFALVSNFDLGRVHIVDPAAGSMVRELVDVEGAEDTWERVDPARYLVASFQTERVLTFDADGVRKGPVYLTGAKPIGVLATSTELWVSNYGDNSVSVFELASP